MLSALCNNISLVTFIFILFSSKHFVTRIFSNEIIQKQIINNISRTQHYMVNYMNKMSSKKKPSTSSNAMNLGLIPPRLRSQIYSFLDNQSIANASLANKGLNKDIKNLDGRKLLLIAASKFAARGIFPVNTQEQKKLETIYARLPHSITFNIIQKGTQNHLVTSQFITLISAANSLQGKQTLVNQFILGRFNALSASAQRLRQCLATANLNELTQIAELFPGDTKTKKIINMYKMFKQLKIMHIIKRNIIYSPVSCEAIICVNEKTSNKKLEAKTLLVKKAIHHAQQLLRKYQITLKIKVKQIIQPLVCYNKNKKTHTNSIISYSKLYHEENTICCFAVDKIIEKKESEDGTTNGISFFDGPAVGFECCLFNLENGLSGSTIAHEFIHVITNSPEHHPAPNNIMFTEAGVKILSGTFFLSKFSKKTELDLVQLLQIKAGKFVS